MFYLHVCETQLHLDCIIIHNPEVEENPLIIILDNNSKKLLGAKDLTGPISFVMSFPVFHCFMANINTYCKSL